MLLTRTAFTRPPDSVVTIRTAHDLHCKFLGVAPRHVSPFQSSAPSTCGRDEAFWTERAARP
jgi:hypothetical protein